MCWASFPQLPYVSTAIGIHIHPNSRHFESLAACFLISADRAATPANLLDSFRETGYNIKWDSVQKNSASGAFQVFQDKQRMKNTSKNVSCTRII